MARVPMNRVCIVMMSAVGDAVHVLPVITALKRANPAMHITWILQPGPATLVRGHPLVDEIILFDRTAGRAVLTIDVLREGWTRPWKLDRSRLPGRTVQREELRGGDASENAAMLRRLLEGESGARREAVLWNAAVALTVEGSASDVADGYERAAHAM